MPIEPGQIIEGKYRVLRRIGEGGMGTVYEGENVRIERRVAIKVLHAHVAQMPEFAHRFEREARASARIGSPHVCDVLDLGDLPNGERYIVMEFLEGMSLEDRLSATKLSPDELAPVAFQILEGLGTMHNAGVVHRDLKPANVFLVRQANRRVETVKILDFGVAKIVPRVDEPGQMTSTGMMMGTPLYMSPEQARGAREVDGRADLYSASVIFYRALSGALPYVAENLHELIFKIALEEPRPLLDVAPDLDEDFAGIVMRGLARDRDQRYASARAYQEAIAEWGKKKGRASLAFALTLPSEPPPLLTSSGRMPAAPAVTPVGTGTVALSPAASTDGGSQAQPSGSRGEGPAAEAEGGRRRSISGRTPTAWSGRAPIVDPADLAGPSQMRPSAGHAESAPPPAAAAVTSVSRAPMGPTKRLVLIGAGALVLGALGVFAFRPTSSAEPATTAPPPSQSAPLGEAPPPPEPPAPPPAPTATEAVPPATEPTEATAAPPVLPPPRREPARAVPTLAATAPTLAATAPTLTATAPTLTATASAKPAASSSAAPTATATPTTTGTTRRKFRTDL